MGDADSIEAIFFQNTDAPFLGIVIFAGTQYTVVMVDTAAPEQYALTIDQQARFGAPFQLPDANIQLPLIFFSLYHAGVEIRSLRAPQLCVGNSDHSGHSGCDQYIAVVNFNCRRSLCGSCHIYLDLRRIDGYGLDMNCFDMYLIPNQ